MITNIKIHNFKSLNDIDLELRNLNLLTGLNGSGKSSLIQTLLILRQSKNHTKNDYMRELLLNGSLFKAGLLEDILFKKDYSKILKEFGKAVIEPKELIFNLSFFKQDDLLVNVKANEIENQINFSNIQFSNIKKSTLDIGWLTKHSLFNDNFQYLFAERHNYNDSYKISVEEVINKKTIGNFGEHTAFYLKTYGKDKEIKNSALHHPRAKSISLIDQTNAWLSEISPNTDVKTFIKNETDVELKYKQGGNSYRPRHVGFGLSYILPVIVTLLTAEEDKLIIIENPESHIHPRGQAELGRLLAACSETKAQLIIETHSDHILNGVRLAAKENLTKAENIIAHYFKRDVNENASKVTPIVLDEKGKLFSQTSEGKSADLPKGFFDEWGNMMYQLF